MSGAARSVAFKHYQRAIARWPKDPLRPEAQFRDVLAKRVTEKFAHGKPVNEAQELKQVNALYSLLDNRYKRKYEIYGTLLEPQSNPTYYADLITELEEAPKRSWLGRVGKRLGGMVRFS